MTTNTIFEEGIIHRDIELTIRELDGIPVEKFYDNLKKFIETKINMQIGGRCNENGYIKPNSVVINTISVGLVKNYHIKYSVICSCLISTPVEGMVLKCIAQTITNGGIKAAVVDYPDDSPMVIFVAREISSSAINSISENDIFMAKVIGVHFELNDQYVSVLAKILLET